MATIIDSLIVTLGLNAANFTQGQKSAVASLQQLQQQAARTSTNVQRSGAGIVTFFNNAQHPVNALHQAFARLAMSTATTAPLQTNLNRMAAQGRVTGAGIQAGALQGAAGLRILGATGLAAFATFTALNKVMSAAKENAGNVFRTGMGAAGAGMGVQGFSAIAQALNVAGNAPVEDTQRWLAEYRQWRLKLNTSQGDKSRLTPLAETGAGLTPYTDTGEEVLIKLARKLPTVDDDEAIKLGGLASLTAAQSIALKKAGANLPALTATEAARATTEGQVKGASDLLKGSNNLTIALDNLSRIVFEKLNPSFEKMYNWLAKIIGVVTGGVEGKTDAASSGSRVGGNVLKGFLQGGPLGAVIEGTKSLLGERGKPRPAATAPIRGAPSGMDPSMAARLDVISKYESNGKNDMDKSGTSTAGGYYKFTDPTWRDHAGAEILAKYPRAIDAPKEIQAAVARKLYLARGFQPWEAMKDPARQAEANNAAQAARIKITPLSGMARGIAPVSGGGGMGWGGIRVQKGNISLPPNLTNYTGEEGPGFPRGGGTGLDTSHVPPARGRFGLDHLEFIRRTNAEARARVSNNTTTNSSSVNTGDINVHTQATDAAGTGGAVSSAIRRMVTESNYGLTG